MELLKVLMTTMYSRGTLNQFIYGQTSSLTITELDL